MAMAFIVDLWLAILVSAFAVWVLSAVFWMVLPHHQKDFRKLPDEDALIEALRAMGAGAGDYAFPFACDSAARKDEELMKRWAEGPSGFMTIMGRMSMGRNMLISFVIYVLCSVLIAYVLRHTLADGAGSGRVFQIGGTCGVMAYTLSSLPNSVWFGHTVRRVAASTFDGVVYGLATGAVFAWLWPAAQGG